MKPSSGKNTVNLLHLTDLHFGLENEKDKVAIEMRISAFKSLIEVLKHERLDLIAISGDLSWQGKPAGYDAIESWLKNELLPAAKLTPADCVICPGNHDLNVKAAFVSSTKDHKQADGYLDPSNIGNDPSKRFEEYIKFAKRMNFPAPIFQGEENHLVGVTAPRKGLQFVCLNSAWFCKDDGSDKTNLWLGLPQLKCMASQLPNPEGKEYDTNKHLTVTLVHHTKEWFYEDELKTYEYRRSTYDYMVERSHVILSGHSHKRPEKADRLGQRAYLFEGGATYAGKSYQNNFSILQIDVGKRVVVRRHFEFDPAYERWEKKRDDGNPYKLKVIESRTKTAKPKERDAGQDKAYKEKLSADTKLIEIENPRESPELDKNPFPPIKRLYQELTYTEYPGPLSKKVEMGDEAQPKRLALQTCLHRKHSVIVGDPGSGKTTFIRWVSWMLCQEKDTVKDFALKGFPLFLRVREMDGFIPPNEDATDPDWIPRFLANKYKILKLGEDYFKKKLKNRDTFLLLDGLDEGGSQRRREQLVAMVVAAAAYPCRIVVTTRRSTMKELTNLKGRGEPPFGAVFINDLSDTDIEKYLKSWSKWVNDLGPDEETPALLDYHAKLLNAVEKPEVRELAGNPLMLTLLATLHHRQHKLPEERVRLYKEIVTWLAKEAARKHPECSDGLLLVRLRTLALHMLRLDETKGQNRFSIDLGQAANVIAKETKQDSDAMKLFLETAQSDNGIVTLKNGKVEFWHRYFQDYLAAVAIEKLTDFDAVALSFLNLEPGITLLPLLAGYIHCEGEVLKLDKLFETLAQSGKGAGLERKAHLVGVMGKMLADLAVGKTKYKLSPAAQKSFEELRKDVMKIFTPGGTKGLALQTRKDAAQALDQVNPELRLFMPDEKEAGQYWVDIKPGKFFIGGEGLNALPREEKDIKGFQIARFPVTVWEYNLYLLDEKIPDQKKPVNWPGQMKSWSRPVTGVTWFDADAYCKWVSKRYKLKVRLPKEEEWEFAARGKNSRIYPWVAERGKKPTEHLANFREDGEEFDRKKHHPTPVGMFPDGNTPEGAADMAGNVWEWTSLDYQHEQAKVVRGGSCLDVATYLRAATCVWVGPVNRDDGVGFRCLRD